MSLSKDVKTALDETRLLILGAQVLLGFQLQAMFREGFESLRPVEQYVSEAALLLMAGTIGLLIAPSIQHRLVEGGKDSTRLLGVARRYAMAALITFAFAIAADFHVVFAKHAGSVPGFVAAAAFSVVCVSLWFLFPAIVARRLKPQAAPPMDDKPASLENMIEQMLTEARVILPGVQALLGFQLIACFAEMFGRLPPLAQYAHFGALAANALSMVLLMTPAALHRIAFQGADDPRFLEMGSYLVAAAPFWLAVGLATDVGVVAQVVAATRGAPAFVMGGAVFFGSFALWYVWPTILSIRKR